MITIIPYGDTDTGREKALNEDRFLINEDLGIYAVADGLGGLPEGAKAASLALEFLEEELKESLGQSQVDFHRLFNKINQQVHVIGKEIAEQTSIGTTLTSMVIKKDKAQIIQIGDSAVFLVRDNELKQLTEEHTMAADLANAYGNNYDAIPDFMFHTLTACIGQSDSITPQITEIQIKQNDLFLICSDGISKYLAQDKILKTCNPKKTPKTIVKKLIQLADNAGGIDNATCIILSCKSD